MFIWMKSTAERLAIVLFFYRKVMLRRHGQIMNEKVFKLEPFRVTKNIFCLLVLTTLKYPEYNLPLRISIFPN